MPHKIQFTDIQIKAFDALEEGKTDQEIIDSGICGAETLRKVKSARKDGATPPSKNKAPPEITPPNLEKPKVSDNGQKPGQQATVQSPARGPRRPSTSGDGKKAEDTKNISEATFLKLVPKAFTITYTPIMMMARAAAVREWGWDPDTLFEDFIDTILYHAFRDRNILLQGYIVQEEEPNDSKGP